MNKIKVKEKILDFFQLPILKNLIYKWGNPCTILCFHRVINDNFIYLENGPNRNLCVTSTFFENLLMYLKEEFNVISVEKIKEIELSKSDKRYICITFDDGYLDNYLNAVPILKHHDMPATFFITNDFIDKKGIIWWYELWDVLLKINYLEFNFKNKKYSFKLSNVKNKLNAFIKIRKLIMSLDISNIKYLLQIISKNKLRKSYYNKFMSWEHIKEIDRDNLFTIGSHTLSHTILRNETPKFVKNQIFDLKLKIEKKLNHKINYLAYPYGSIREVNKREFNIAEQLGFEIAFTTSCKNENTNLFSLPRIVLTDYFKLKGIDIRLNGLSNFLGSQFG